MTLFFNLVFSDCGYSFKTIILRGSLYSSEIISVYHEHYAISKLLGISLCTTRIETLEKIEFCLIVTWSLENLHPDSRAPDR